mmetsp:Transcript_37553/g.99958  ORF Transcript_37553/g.99958 Transcript_37553/m.99958 type:complete len:93 (+) Transcript_37553:630-908(+)
MRWDVLLLVLFSLSHHATPPGRDHAATVSLVIFVRDHFMWVDTAPRGMIFDVFCSSPARGTTAFPPGNVLKKSKLCHRRNLLSSLENACPRE